MPGAELLYLLRSLNDSARNVLAIGLGEALRLGTPWLGVEFLIMGLVRHPEELLPGFFRDIKMDPSVIRAALRGLIPIANKNWRRVHNVERLGNKTLTELQEIDREALIAVWDSEVMPRAVITPRLRMVLRKAVAMAEGGKVGPDHLLLALVDHPHAPAVELLLGMVEPNAKQPPRKLIAWIEEWRRDPITLRERIRPPARQTTHASTPAPPSSSGSYTPPSPLASPEPPPPQSSPDPSAGGEPLDIGRLGRDLTQAARQGKFKPAVGKSAGDTLVQLGSVLLQARAGNPLLVGDPGVGKTAAVEGFAWRLAVGRDHGQPVAAQLADWRLIELRTDALAQVVRRAGKLETWVAEMTRELASGQGRSVLFLDDVHLSLKAQDADGAKMKALLELLLEREEIPCVCAVTPEGYSAHFKRGGALGQQVTPIWMREPSVQESIAIARSVAQERLAPQHDIYYPPEAVEASVKLAVRYLHDELLPGKAVRLLDQAGTSVLLNGTLNGAGPSGPISQVTIDILRELVSDKSGVPLTRLRENEGEKLVRLEQELSRCVSGQSEALERVLQVIRRSKAGLSDPHRPLGVFLFVGPGGAGQIELSMALAEALFDQKDAYLHISMSEYRDLSRIADLLGDRSHAGGSLEEGRITAWLRRHPFSVIFLDGIEQAHPEVQHLLLRLFDSSRVSEVRGAADARNAIFIMTTGIGVDARISSGSCGEDDLTEILNAVEAQLAPELLDRVDRVVPFKAGDDQSHREVLEAKLTEITKRLQRGHGITLRVTDGFKQGLCSKVAGAPRAASRIRRSLEHIVERRLTEPLLAGEISRGAEVVLDVGDLSASEDGKGGRS